MLAQMALVASVTALALSAATPQTTSRPQDAGDQTFVARSALAKGDRTVPARLGRSGPAVAVESMGSSVEALTMRDGTGRIVYEASHIDRTTSVSKNIVLPPLPSAVPPSPVVVRPRPPAGQAVPVGCDRLVSALVKSALSSVAGRCVT
jgi:hypothetical protein